MACTPKLTLPDQVSINRAQVVVNGRNRYDRDFAFGNNPVQKQIEAIGVASPDKQPRAIIVKPGFDNVVLIENMCG